MSIPVYLLDGNSSSIHHAILLLDLNLSLSGKVKSQTSGNLVVSDLFCCISLDLKLACETNLLIYPADPVLAHSLEWELSQVSHQETAKYGRIHLAKAQSLS